DNAEAWLIAVARRKTIDALRRRRSGEGAVEELRMMAQELAAVAGSDIPDQRLALMFACAPPGLDSGITAPLVLPNELAVVDQPVVLPPPSTPPTPPPPARPPRPNRVCPQKNKTCSPPPPFRPPPRPTPPTRQRASPAPITPPSPKVWPNPAGTEIRRRNLAE